MIAAQETPKAGNVEDLTYRNYLERVQFRFEEMTKLSALFTTDAAGLWDAYLMGYHPNERQYHNCNACRHFIERFGGLVVIEPDGRTRSALFDLEDCADYRDQGAIANMLKMLNHAKVTGPFLSAERTLGTPVTGAWRHLNVSLRPGEVYRGIVKTAGQAMAEKREDFANVRRALREFQGGTIHAAVALLKSETLFRSEKVLGPAQWLADVFEAVQAAPKALKDNVLWRFIATAPAGFCHPRSSMIGTLLEDLEAGLSVEDAARKFRVKMDPLHYMRPQAAPAAGNIARAEKLVETLGLGPSLARRFARLEELELVWRPREAAGEPQPAAGVFGHLKPKLADSYAKPLRVNGGAITWEKFARAVLPDAVEVRAHVPAFRGAFYAITTAANPDAPPLLRWDSPERRNPFAVYTYHGGSYAQQWGLTSTPTRVTGITLNPVMWHGDHGGNNKQAFAILQGCRDSRTGQGNAIFPETLRSELHEIRATVEAYSKTAELGGREEASACGLPVVGTTFDVADARGNVTTYKIDRWD